jgi:DNA-directed RNA polymerase subunit K/omega
MMMMMIDEKNEKSRSSALELLNSIVAPPPFRPSSATGPITKDHKVEKQNTDNPKKELDSSQAAVNKVKKTMNYLNKVELTRLLAERAIQITQGESPQIDVEEISALNMIPDALLIAAFELKHKTIPMVLKRMMPDQSIEEWDPNTMLVDAESLSILTRTR